MSLILEALNKAEQRHSTPNSYNVPQASPLETKTNSRWILFVLVTAACLISAIVTYFIIQQLSTNNETTYLETPATHNSKPAAANQIEQQPPIQKQNSTPSYRQQASIPSVSTTMVQTPVHTPPTDFTLAEHREPGLRNLVKRSDYSNKASAETNANKTTNTTLENKSKPSATTTRQAAVADNIDLQSNQNIQREKEIKDITGSQLSDIEISVHMYSKTPAKRFIYINSTRYGEGAMIGNGIFLDEITENGIIINNNGTLYRLPIKL